MTLTPTTPPGTPALPDLARPAPPHPFQGFRSALQQRGAQVLSIYREPLDRSGFAALASYGLSAISAALAVGVTYTSVLTDPTLREIIAFWYRYGGRWLWALPIVFGLYSQRTLPRIAAWLGIGTMVLIEVWRPLYLGVSLFLPLKVLYLTGALVLALPPLLRRLIDRQDAT